LGLLIEDHQVSAQASPCIKSWSLFLSFSEYSLTFRDTKTHVNVDALSRLPMHVNPGIIETPPELVVLAEHLQSSSNSEGYLSRE